MNYRVFIAKIIKTLPYLYINLIRLFGLIELYQPTYNPKKFYLVHPKLKRRDCDDRILAIQKNVDFTKIRSYLDVGSQLGYFVFKLCESNKIWGQGMEMDSMTCNYANSIAMLNSISNVSFSNSKLTMSSVRNMPNYDMISFLNIFHHMVYFDGFNAADSTMRQLYLKCNSYFIFETGQFDEKGYYWGKSLSFMGNEPEKWIKDYLIRVGYKDVNLVGRFSTHLSDRNRAFFICSK